MKRFAFVLLVLSTPLVTGCNQEAKRQANAAAWADLDRSMERDNAEAQLKLDQINYQNIQLEFGDETAIRWDKCLNDPPKTKRNQASCAKLLAHIKSVQAANAKADAAKEAKW